MHADALAPRAEADFDFDFDLFLFFFLLAVGRNCGKIPRVAGEEQRQPEPGSKTTVMCYGFGSNMLRTRCTVCSTEKGSALCQEELTRYTKQLEVVQEICAQYEVLGTLYNALYRSTYCPPHCRECLAPTVCGTQTD
eukprot:275872-Rhodomonas_salina.1